MKILSPENKKNQPLNAVKAKVHLKFNCKCHSQGSSTYINVWFVSPGQKFTVSKNYLGCKLICLSLSTFWYQEPNSNSTEENLSSTQIHQTLNNTICANNKLFPFSHTEKCTLKNDNNVASLCISVQETKSYKSV